MENTLQSIGILIKDHKRLFKDFNIAEEQLLASYNSIGGSSVDFMEKAMKSLIIMATDAYENDETTKRDYLFRLRNIYSDLTIFKRKHLNTTANDTYQLFLLSDLIFQVENARTTKVEKEVEILADDVSACSYCRRNNGKKINLHDALDTSPIDTSKCSCKNGCKAMYLLNIRR